MQKFHRGQRVKHPHWGLATFVRYVPGSEDVLGEPQEAEIQIDVGSESERPESVSVANLEVMPWLGDRWKFEFYGNGSAHTNTVVRVGTPGSRALSGSLVLTKEEAKELEIAVRSMGAEVEVER